MKSIKNLLLIFILSICFSNAYAQVRGNANQNYNRSAAANATYGNLQVSENVQNKQPANATFFNDYTTILRSRVLMNVEADSYTAVFHLTQVGETAADADKFMNERLNGLKTALTALGVPSNEMETDIICLVPIFEYEEEKKIFSKKFIEVPKGFELKKNIHIRYTKSTMLDKIVTAAAQNEIYDLVKVDYSIKDMEAVYDQMRAKAIANYKKKLAMYKDLGIDLATQYHVATDASNVTFPLECYSTYQAFSSSSLDKGKTAKRAAKPTSYYYNPITPKGFDVVVNSSILEPVVQFTYDLQVKFLIERPVKPQVKQEVIKKFFIIGENGNFRELPTN
ncbi:MAG: SIMPL domain-containing protein [Saprospiraceae bacterium]